MPEGQAAIPTTTRQVYPENSEGRVVRPLVEESQSKNMNKLLVPLVLVVIVGAGIGTGYALANRGGSDGGTITGLGGNKQVAQEDVKKGLELGDESAFKDEQSAEGVLQVNDGSVTTEGTHQLVREGGPSQTVFLTSSTIDLSKFVDKKVMLKGETFAGQTAGWFMDVGWIKVIE